MDDWYASFTFYRLIHIDKMHERVTVCQSEDK
jgi:hypothetical protein